MTTIQVFDLRFDDVLEFSLFAEKMGLSTNQLLNTIICRLPQEAVAHEQNLTTGIHTTDYGKGKRDGTGELLDSLVGSNFFHDLRNETDGSGRHCPRCGHVGLSVGKCEATRAGIAIDWRCPRCQLGEYAVQQEAAAS